MWVPRSARDLVPNSYPTPANFDIALVQISTSGADTR